MIVFIILCRMCATGDYMNSDQVYEDIQNMAALKKHMMEVLNEYNSSAGVIHMSLVLFRDAIEHS